MTRLLAIDPGPTESAYVLYDASGQLAGFDKAPNLHVLGVLETFSRPTFSRAMPVQLLAVEMIRSYGMPVGMEVFETCVWIGRFIQVWVHAGGSIRFVTRSEVKTHICHDSRAKDSNVRQAIIDRYGGKENAIGRKAMVGPLYGVKGDCWQALGVAITATETAP